MSIETIAQVTIAVTAIAVIAGLVLAGWSPRHSRHHRGLDIRPLGLMATEHYRREWTEVQDHLGDKPDHAITEADHLVTAVMVERGYPTEPADDGGQCRADLSPGDARTLDHYRRAHEISSRAAQHVASTEDLRQAVTHYRILFEELLDEDAATSVRQ